MACVPHMEKSNGIAVSEPGSVSAGALLFLRWSTRGTNHSPARAVLQAPAGHSPHHSRRSCAQHRGAGVFTCPNMSCWEGQVTLPLLRVRSWRGRASCFCRGQCPAWREEREQHKSQCKWAGYCCFPWRAFSTSPRWFSSVIKNGCVGRHITTDAGILFLRCDSQLFWVLGSSGTSCDFCVFSKAQWISHSWSSPIFFWACA